MPFKDFKYLINSEIKTKTVKGKTIKEILLKLQAESNSKWIKCIIALVIPQPKHSVFANKTDKHIDCPSSK